PGEKIVRVGNAAVEGACIALLSRAKRNELEAVTRRVKHCRLEAHERFFDFFVEGCQFKPVDASLATENA
ncbi:MAG TPA: ASKHA domain-containing protein, partial [Candidatus Baltobacteraceae bacterium]|nr:ASKHA domain-containing protein [Candidatus Baltobacteraceae bacterium]